VEEGAISAAYSGPATDAMPTPKPTTNRDTTRTHVPGARLSPSAPTANSTPPITMVFWRPSRSARPPASSAPTSAPRVTQLVTTSCKVVLRWKSLAMNCSAPAMTPWSYPNSSPVKMTTRPTMNSQKRNRPNMSFGVAWPTLPSAAVVAISFPPR